jgi:electron transport complex protein RnfD
MSTIPEMSGPYVRKEKSVTRTMVLVMLALVPATAYGLYIYGWPAIILFTISIGSALLFEVVSLLIARKPVVRFVSDGSAILTAWLLAISLPPWAPWWVAVLGSAMAIIVAKHVFGGLGQNVFNPAMVGRVVLLLSFPLEMTAFVDPLPLFSADAPTFLQGLQIVFGGTSIDAYAGATVLDSIKTAVGQGGVVQDGITGERNLIGWLIGNNAGSMAEGADVLLLLGGLMMIFTRVIRWFIPVSMLLSIAIISTVFNWIDPTIYPDATVHLFTGSAILGAFFIATDPVTSPTSPKGQLFFGVMLGVLIYVIRTWAQYPEGMSFAILLMNAITPLINRYLRPRIFGRTNKGDPLGQLRQ